MIKNNVNKVHKTVYVQHNTVDNKYIILTYNA